MQVYDRLHPVMASGALKAVARHTLEELLADPANALESVAAEVATVLPGTRLDAIKVTAITLPPETRKMFTEAERARRQGLAALERARGEQASLRALANAARNLANNPELARLRTLQTMESAQGAKTFILGELPREVGLPERN
jgi:regulator of protease activity HflC (stomatin/prohibitin superfamily)